MKTRVVREKEGYWRIRCGMRGISHKERDRLVKYFQKIKFPYEIIESQVVVPTNVDRETIFNKLEKFYEGEANIYPF